MKPKRINIAVIPANEGFKPIYAEDDGGYFLGITPVLAWRISTYERQDESNELFEFVEGITIDGVISNVAGYVNPDGSVSICCDRDFKTIEEFSKAHKITIE